MLHSGICLLVCSGPALGLIFPQCHGHFINAKLLTWTIEDWKHGIIKSTMAASSNQKERKVFWCQNVGPRRRTTRKVCSGWLNVIVRGWIFLLGISQYLTKSIIKWLNMLLNALSSGIKLIFQIIIIFIFHNKIAYSVFHWVSSWSQHLKRHLQTCLTKTRLNANREQLFTFGQNMNTFMNTTKWKVTYQARPVGRLHLLLQQVVPVDVLEERMLLQKTNRGPASQTAQQHPGGFQCYCDILNLYLKTNLQPLTREHFCPHLQMCLGFQTVQQCSDADPRKWLKTK